MSCNRAMARGSFDSPTVQAVAAGGTVQFQNTTATCKDIAFNGGDIAIRRPGTYLVSFNATTAADAAGTEEIQMFRDGNSVPGAHALETAAAADDLSSLSFSTLVTVECCGTANLSFRSAVATGIRVANVVITAQEV